MGGGSSSAAKAPAVRRNPIFEKNNNTMTKADLIEILKNDINKNMPPDAKSLILESLGGFFFLGDENESNQLRIDLLLRSMTIEYVNQEEYVMREGEAGSKLYIVESGEIEVTIQGKVIRSMSRGALFGELALLYNAPRSATIQCKTDCTFWSLNRYMFKNIQAFASSTSTIQRSKCLMDCPELRSLGSVGVSRLISQLVPKTYEKNEVIFEAHEPTRMCILIETGSVQIEIPQVIQGANIDLCDEYLNIIRPAASKKQKSLSDMSLTELQNTIMKISDPDEADDNSSPNSSLVNFFGASNNGQESLKKGKTIICTEGCVVGIGAFRVKASRQDVGLWKWQNETCICPFKCTALGSVQVSMFSIDIFESIFGRMEDVFVTVDRPLNSIDEQTENMEGSKSFGQPDYTPTVAKSGTVKYDYSRFTEMNVLGSGSYGVVVLAQYLEEDNVTSNIFALKKIDKTRTVEAGHFSHIMAEKKILQRMKSPFVLKIFGTTSSANELIFVTEVVDRGDLWSVIYETPSFKKQLPALLIQFYVASIVLALDHIHSNNVSYRDLKPENVMLDSSGHVRIIDFGFAKVLPYVVTDENGEKKIYKKSFTLCGTPEYLAPEFIFNSGNDSSADIWALGVLMHEMYLFKTPFVGSRPDDMTELFINIASVKKVGIALSSRIDAIDNSSNARSLMSMFLQSEPAERISVQEGRRICILDHKYFKNIDIQQVESRAMTPPHVPDQHPLHSLDSIAKAAHFRGDNNQFAEF